MNKHVEDKYKFLEKLIDDNYVSTINLVVANETDTNKKCFQQFLADKTKEVTKKLLNEAYGQHVGWTGLVDLYSKNPAQLENKFESFLDQMIEEEQKLQEAIKKYHPS